MCCLWDRKNLVLIPCDVTCLEVWELAELQIKHPNFINLRKLVLQLVPPIHFWRGMIAVIVSDCLPVFPKGIWSLRRQEVHWGWFATDYHDYFFEQIMSHVNDEKLYSRYSFPNWHFWALDTFRSSEFKRLKISAKFISI